MLNDEDLNQHKIKIKDSKTKEEQVLAEEDLLWYLDEQLADKTKDCHCDHDDCCCHEEER